MGLIINWIVIITSPAFSYSMYQILKKEPKAHKVILGISGLVVLIFLLGHATGIVFTVKIINEIILSAFYFSVCFLFWQVLRIKEKFVRGLLVIIGLIPMIFGLFLGTIGIIAFGAIYEQFWSDRQYEFSNNNRLEITSLSLPLEPGGIKVDIYHKFSFMPIQQKIISRTFDDFYINLNSVCYSYNEEKQEVKIWTEGYKSNKKLDEVIKINGS